MTSLVVTTSVGLTFFNKAKKEYDAELSGHLSVRAFRGRSGPASWCPQRITGPPPRGK